MNGSPILDSATLQKAVRESAGKALDMEVMRDVSQLHFTVKPRQIEASYFSLVDGKDPLTEAGRFAFIAPHLPDVMPQVHVVQNQDLAWLQPMARPAPGQPSPIQKQLQEIEKQLAQMTKAIEALSEKK